MELDIKEANQTTLNTLFGPDGETVIAESMLVGPEGQQRLEYHEYDTREVRSALSGEGFATYPNGRAFYSLGCRAETVAHVTSNPRFGNYARNFGFEFHKRPYLNFALPTAGYLNAVLDDLAQGERRFRFFEPESENGKISGKEYITKLALGLVPVAKADSQWFDHDISGHALGYTLIDSKTTRVIQNYAAKIVREGIEENERGELQYDSRNAHFADAVDGLSGSLSFPLQLTLGSGREKRGWQRRAAGRIPSTLYPTPGSSARYSGGPHRGWATAARIMRSRKELGI